jgi:SAM-dependent methyltransferase
MNGKGTLHVAQACIAAEPDLLARILPAPDQVGIAGQPGQPRQFARQQHGLVVAPEAQPAGMERHRHEDRRRGPEVAACRSHEPGAEARQLRPVAIFETRDQGPGHLPIAHRSASAGEGRGIGESLGRARFGPEIHLEGDAKHRAERRRNLAQRSKAVRTQAVGRNKWALAGEAGRWIELVKQPGPKPGKASAQPPQRPDLFDFPALAVHKGDIALRPAPAKAPPMSTPPRLFDDVQIARNLTRRQTPDNFVRDLVVEDLGDRLSAYRRDFTRAVLIGPDAGSLPATLFTANGPVMVRRVEAFSGADFPDLPEGEQDLIVSLLHLQAVNDVPGHLARLRRLLRPDGLLLAAFVGGESLSELREAFLAADLQITGGASARVSPMAQVRDAGALLQRAGFALPVADVETHRVRYANPFALMAELKALGASNPLADRPRRFATRTLLAAAAAAYAERDADPDGRVRATLEIVWLAGWVPHESQQKPLRPGSATVSMKDVLGGGGP